MPDDDRDERAFRVDAAMLSVGFATALRRAGIPTTPDRSAWFADSLRLVPPRTRSELYWTSRAVFVTAQHQLERFDAVFEAVFGGAADPADLRGDANGPDDSVLRRRAWAEPAPVAQAPSDAPTPGSPQPASPGAGEGRDEGEDGTESFLLAASPEERLHDTSFDALTADEADSIRRLVAALVVATPLRPGRRRRRSAHADDRVDLRRTVRAARRTGGDVVRLVHTDRMPRPRRLVLLADVSASMEPYTRVFLSLLQAAVVGSRAEAFVFATRLTRLTRQLALRDPDRAFEQAASAARDWAGGTRLADAVRDFVDDHGRRGIARGAIVVILSDGWALDDPADIERQMARLSRLAHRIVWVNPRRAAHGFRPLTGGMSAALPYCDAFVSGHSYTALQDLVRVIADDTAPSTRRRIN